MSSRGPLLSSAGQVEGMEVSDGRRPPAVHPVHLRHARALFGSLLEPFQVGPVPFGDELDRSVIAVAHPTAQAQALSLPHQEVAKPNSLHVAVHDPMQALHWLEAICCPHANF